MLRRLLRSLFAARTAAPQRARRVEPSVREAPASMQPVLTRPNRTRLPIDAQQQLVGALSRTEREIFGRVAQRVDACDLDLPRLPSTASKVIELAARPGIGAEDVTATLASDPSLCAELLRTANSAAYAGVHEIETVHDAVVRLGTRTLRSLVLRTSLRGTILRQKSVLAFALETWRQATAVSQVCRVVAPEAGMDAEHGALLGLMHDIGKVALLAMLAREAPSRASLSTALFGHVFVRFHEPAGAAMARLWKLPDEIIEVAGRHHDFRRNERFPKSAALVSLAHKIDLFGTQGDETSFRALAYAPEMLVLGIAPGRRQELLAELAQELADVDAA